ncbi:hypothetical protein EON65_23610 [archaeon]|nr:MAG: hypothetical protein EON65_23610 [archaeon]
MNQKLWEPIAKIALQGAYEATLYAAILHMLNHKDDAGVNHSDSVFLTFLGGGVFGNDMLWIIEAIASALHEVQHQVDSVSEKADRVVERKELKVNVCHFRNQNRFVVEGLEAVEGMLKSRISLL